MVKIITSLSNDVLNKQEIESWLSEDGAENISITKIADRSIITFDIKSGSFVTPMQGLQMLELSSLMGYSVLYSAYSDGEDYKWQRNVSITRGKLASAIHIISSDFNLSDDAKERFDYTINTVASVLELDFDTCTKLLVELEDIKQWTKM